MQRVKGCGGDFAGQVEMPQIGARMVAAGIAAAGGIDGAVVLRIWYEPAPDA